MQNLNEYRLQKLKLSKGNEVRDVRTTDGLMDIYTDGQRENIIPRH